MKPSFYLKLFRDGEVTLKSKKRTKARILYLARETDWDMAYLKVVYNDNAGLYNDGTYTRIEDMIWALNAFTEPSLIEYASTGKVQVSETKRDV